MNRSLFLLLLFLASYRGQAQTPHADTSVPQKLQLKKIELYKPASSPNLTPQNSSQKKDSTRSMVYIGPKSKDTLKSLIPPLQKTGNIEVKVKAGGNRYLNQRH